MEKKQIVHIVPLPQEKKEESVHSIIFAQIEKHSCHKNKLHMLFFAILLENVEENIILKRKGIKRLEKLLSTYLSIFQNMKDDIYTETIILNSATCVEAWINSLQK